MSRTEKPPALCSGGARQDRGAGDARRDVTAEACQASIESAERAVLPWLPMLGDRGIASVIRVPQRLEGPEPSGYAYRSHLGVQGCEVAHRS